LLLTKKHFFTLALTFLSALLPMQQSQADNTANRAALTQATLELQRDILLTREKHLTEERIGLNFYLNIDQLLTKKPDSISISLAGKVVLKQDFNDEQFKILEHGGMQKLGAIELTPGKHEFQVLLRANNRNITKTIELEKSTGSDNLKITITSFMQQRNPEIIFDHETWTAVQ